MTVLGRSVAVGGAFLLVATIWLTADSGGRAPSGPLWPVAAAAVVLIVVWRDAQGIRSARLARALAGAAVVAAVLGWLVAADPAAGPFWPAVVTGLLLVALGLAAPAGTRPREGRAAARFALRDGAPLPVDTLAPAGEGAPDLGEPPKFAGGLLLVAARRPARGTIAIG
ncbi:hypothetical protein ACPPVO_28705 [Dactylosporangium sp. McL0621]|uniref:hypothetical protein n=1 Tax=Dactylosporangium sp. McL0621 TaxID=3415678 RepID=UPI003CF6C4C0